MGQKEIDTQHLGNLLHYLVAPGVTFLTSTEVIDRVLQENEDDTLRGLKEAKDNLKGGELRIPLIKKEIKSAKKELKHINEMAFCQHYLDRQPPGKATEGAAFALGELPLQL